MLIEFPGSGSYAREWLEEHPERTQQLLAQCKGRYPLCMCRAPGLPLYIARRNRLYLARLPNTGPQHAPSCPSYEPDRSMSGFGIYSARALSECGEGCINLKLGVPLAIRGERAGAGPGSTVMLATENSLREAVALPGLLHLLWERAGFNRWSPKMKNRRHYRQLYKYVLEAAETVQVRRKPITQRLYMPEPYVPDQALEIESRRQQAFRQLSQTAGGIPMRILVFGRVRSIIDADQPGIRLSNLPNEFVIRVAPEKLAKLYHHTRFAWLDARSLHPEFRLVVLLTMQRSHSNHWVLDELAGMVTTEEYIPAFSIEDALLCKRLINEDRRFYKPLPYDASVTRFPNFLSTDCGERPVPLEIVTSNLAEAATRRLRIAEYEANNRSYWVWDVGESPLPPGLPVPVTDCAAP